MPKSLIGIIVAVVAIGALGGIYAANKPDKSPQSSDSSMGDMDMSGQTMSNSGSNASTQPMSNEVLSGTVEMDIKDFAFAKPAIKVKKGTVVKWTNQDSAKHDITPDNESEAFKGSGKLLAQGESYSFTFNTVGTYTYNCSPHPYMKGSVEVVE